jgi:hypothetical protein
MVSKELMNAGSAKNPCEIRLSTCWVTSRYIRLKQATPSAVGSAASIACILAIASSTDVTGGPLGIGLLAMASTVVATVEG